MAQREGFEPATARSVDLQAASVEIRNCPPGFEPRAAQSTGVPTNPRRIAPNLAPAWVPPKKNADRVDSSVELNDPRRPGPILYFPQMDAPHPQRNWIHLDGWCHTTKPSPAPRRRSQPVLTDEHAPSWWVLSDTEGKDACVARWMNTDRASPTGGTPPAADGCSSCSARCTRRGVIPPGRSAGSCGERRAPR